jgi:hypothetical protein
MMIVLNYWSRRWQSVAFDSRTGEGRIRWLSCKPSRSTGWAVKQEGMWYGLWSDGKDLILQVGKLRVPMTSECSATNERMGKSRRVTVSENGRAVFDLTYSAIDRDTDPTFDMLDLELEDFFFYVSRLCSDEKWKAALIKNWAPSSLGDPDG